MQEVNHENMCEERMERFKGAIRKYKIDNLRAINEKADKEEEFWVNKIKNDAGNQDEETFRRMEDGVRVA